MSELEFSFQDVMDEIDAVSLVAEPFIAPESQNVLAELRGNLRGFQEGARVAPFDWAIPLERPLCTRASVGEYEDGCEGALSVYAEITSMWTIRQVRGRSVKAKAERFSLAGKTSTMVR